jgi:hypothetical protein
MKNNIIGLADRCGFADRPNLSGLEQRISPLIIRDLAASYCEHSLLILTWPLINPQVQFAASVGLSICVFPKNMSFFPG